MNYGFDAWHQQQAIDYSKQQAKIDLKGQKLKPAKHDVGHVISFDYARDKVVQALNGDRAPLASLVRGLTTASAAEAKRSDISPEHAAQLLAHNRRTRRAYRDLAANVRPDLIGPRMSDDMLAKLGRRTLKATSNHLVNTRTLTGIADNRSTGEHLHPVMGPETPGVPRTFEKASERALRETGASVVSRPDATGVRRISAQHGEGPTEDDFARDFPSTPIVKRKS